MSVIKKISVTAIIIGITHSAYATSPGFYFGAMGGMTDLHAKEQTATFPTKPPTIITVTPSNTGYGGRLYLGGDFNRYFGMEGGFTYYSPLDYNSKVLSNNVKTETGSFDVLLKAMFPFGTSGFTVFGKLGPAYLYSKTSGDVEGVRISESSSSTVRAAAGIGVSYDLTQRWVVDLSYNQLFYSSSAVKNPSFTALGISYHFVDEYCGQFLC
jgi:opacity protein-like surface antigen